MYASRGDKAAAQAAFREVLRINPRATAAQVQLAMLQAQTTPAESVRTAEDAVRNEPTSAPARLALVQSLIAAKNFFRAEQELTKLRAEYPNVAASVSQEDARLATLAERMWVEHERQSSVPKSSGCGINRDAPCVPCIGADAGECRRSSGAA